MLYSKAGKLINNQMVSPSQIMVPNSNRTLQRILKDKVSITLFNSNTSGVELTDVKFAIDGDKWIGLQQDSFTITLYNLSYRIAKWIAEGRNQIMVAVNQVPVFAGVVVNVVTGAPNVIDHEAVLTCLTRTTLFYANLVAPYSIPSSVNAFNVLKLMLGDGVEIPEELKEIHLESDLYIEGDVKSEVDSVLRAVNAKLRENDWVEIKYEHDRIDLLSSKKKLNSAYIIDGHGGLIGVPSLSESGLTFDHIYRRELTPGVVIKIDNAILSTLGVNTAWLFTMDPNGLYVITHVKYKFQNYDGVNLSCSIECYPYSKFNNWSVK